MFVGRKGCSALRQITRSWALKNIRRAAAPLTNAVFFAGLAKEQPTVEGALNLAGTDGEFQ